MKKLHMHKGNLFWGLILILAAAVLIIDGLGVELGILHVSVWQLILGILLIAWIVQELFRLKISHIFFPSALLFLLFEGEIARLIGAPSHNLIANWVVLLAALLLTIGFSILFPCRGGNCHIRYSPNGISSRRRGNSENTMSSTATYIDAQELGCAHIENTMGRTEIFIENADAYTGGGTISIENSLGLIVVNVPAEWNVIESCEVVLGTVSNTMPRNPNGKVLYLRGECSLGMVEIKPFF